jgi:hypothetical protein
MNSKATPGPWEFQSGAAIGKPFVIFHRSPDGHTEYVCVMQNVHYADERNEPNARLIAAAPDLLEALIRLRDYYSSSHSPATRESCWAQALAAITQATGADQ